jgi:multidrug efflux pump subunit AcrB
VVEQTVAQVIEDQVIGVDDMIYMSSTSGADGTYILTISFEVGTDPDIATVNVQNRVALAEPLLPAEVRQTGVRVAKRSSSLLMGVALYAENDSITGGDLTNYARINLLDALKRCRGRRRRLHVRREPVRDARGSGRRPPRRAEPDAVRRVGRAAQPERAGRHRTRRRAAGDLRSGSAAQRLDQGRLETPEEFSRIILRSGADGSVVRVGDVAEVTLGERSTDVTTSFDGAPATLIGIYLAPGGNAIAAADGVQARPWSARPSACPRAWPSRSSRTVRPSSRKHHGGRAHADRGLRARRTRGLCLPRLARATIVPLIAVPVALVGTFAVMLAMGFTLNTVSLLALVLAIGIVVDDAIVVVEAVEAKMESRPVALTPAEAASAAMQEITGAIVAITLVLLSVFVPVAFIPGISGQLFQQFAVAVSVSMVISAINALTLSPALCAIVLKPHHGPKTGIMGRISRGIDAARDGYTTVAGALARRSILGLALLVGALVITGGLFRAVPSGFLPSEDQGSFIVETRLPEGASVNRTQAAQREVERMLAELPGVESVTSVTGFSILDGITKSNAAFALVSMEEFAERTTEETSVFAAIARGDGAGRGHSRGAGDRLQPAAHRGPRSAARASSCSCSTPRAAAPRNLPRRPAACLRRQPGSAPSGVYTTFSADSPQLFLDIDRERLYALGIPVSDVFAALQSTLGSSYVNDFNLFGRAWQVRMTAAPEGGTASRISAASMSARRRARWCQWAPSRRPSTRSGPCRCSATTTCARRRSAASRRREPRRARRSTRWRRWPRRPCRPASTSSGRAPPCRKSRRRGRRQSSSRSRFSSPTSSSSRSTRAGRSRSRCFCR